MLDKGFLSAPTFTALTIASRTATMRMPPLGIISCLYVSKATRPTCFMLYLILIDHSQSPKQIGLQLELPSGDRVWHSACIVSHGDTQCASMEQAPRSTTQNSPAALVAPTRVPPPAAAQTTADTWQLRRPSFAASCPCDRHHRAPPDWTAPASIPPAAPSAPRHRKHRRCVRSHPLAAARCARVREARTDLPRGHPARRR
mmetsp:Transcript_5126/g.13773  ORF Transcript_5126/g.13773 Transcript_5126/m.13773 type:complete len:201 (-) Transcript_5126:444-1046(-)